MKIRSGFVTNSSSAIYIVENMTEQMKTMWDLLQEAAAGPWALEDWSYDNDIDSLPPPPADPVLLQKFREQVAKLAEFPPHCRVQVSISWGSDGPIFCPEGLCLYASSFGIWKIEQEWFGERVRMEMLRGDDICGVRAPGYNYIFRKSDGFSMRWGRTQQDSPFWGPVPELADISISNRCSNGCHFCYRNSQPDSPLMSLDDYRCVMRQLPSTFQLALGGGEPTEHPQFIDFLRLSRELGKVPNYTTNGTGLTRAIVEASKKYCGAVAVSWSDSALDAIRQLVEGGVKTNLHFILSKNTINVGIDLLKQPELFGDGGINAIVFLLHKAVGRGKSEDTPTLKQAHPLIVEAFSAGVPVAFDVCSVPHIAAAEKDGDIRVNWGVLDYCDGSRFTVYIDESLNVSPCSFVSGGRFTESLREKSMHAIWTGRKFGEFRGLLKEAPLSCPVLMVDKESECSSPRPQGLCTIRISDILKNSRAETKYIPDLLAEYYRKSDAVTAAPTATKKKWLEHERPTRSSLSSSTCTSSLS